MRSTRLPEDIKRQVNRLAHALAQWSYGEHQRRLEAQAQAWLKEGRNPIEVAALLTQAAKGQ